MRKTYTPNKNLFRSVVAGGVILIPLAIIGCSGGGGGSSSTPIGPQSVSATTANGLTAMFRENTQSISSGGSVTYTMTLTNNTSQPIAFTGSSPCWASSLVSVGGSVNIAIASGTPIFPASPGQTICAGVGASLPATLAPGQSVSATLNTGNVFTNQGTDTATASVSLETGSSGTFQTTTVGSLNVAVQ